MKLARQNKLPTDCVPEEISVFSQDFWIMRKIADNIRWDFANVVVNIGVFEDFARAWWYRVTLEPGETHHPDILIKGQPGDEEHRDYPKSVTANIAFFGPGIGRKEKVIGERCEWPRYKALDVPVSYFDYEHGNAEQVINGYDLAGQLRNGGLE